MKPILFSGPMVQAILEGRKTQTRRVIKRINGISKFLNEDLTKTISAQDWLSQNTQRIKSVIANCPYGQPGDQLWVREGFRPADFLMDGYERDDPYYVQYRADGVLYQIVDEKASVMLDGTNWSTDKKFGRWKPSIHMPRWASRLTLEIIDIRVERLQDISTEDILLEGTPIPFFESGEIGYKLAAQPHNLMNYIRNPEPDKWNVDEFARAYFGHLWDSFNFKRGHGWDTNPWVWVVEFKQV